MDPFSQGALGATLASALARDGQVRTAALLGCAAGLLPDIDVLIQDPSDPLLFLEYHRQFTHSLAFIPLGALICAIALWPLARRHMVFGHAYLYCLLGYATHGLLDACTTYGTQLFWPLSDYRVAWNTISIIDPLFTLPVIALVVIAVRRHSPLFSQLAVAWALAYLSIGLVQRDRAEVAGNALAASRGHTPVRLEAKPGFAQLLLWKLVYEYDGVFYVDAVRVGSNVSYFEGDRIDKLGSASEVMSVPLDSVQARDIERFRWFSNDYLARHPAIDHRLIDIRYSMLPNEIKPLWGIQLDPDHPDRHVRYVTSREAGGNEISRLWQMLWHDQEGASPATIHE